MVGQKIKILVIDDDQELNLLLADYLSQFDFEVLCATHPAEGLQSLKNNRPDLIVLDITLPEKNGFELCKDIRLRSQIPIIILTARGNVDDRLTGFELGADDYVPKPYEPRELVARIQSVLRRAGPSQPSKIFDLLVSPGLTINLEQDCAFLNDERLDLTAAEFEILKLFMKNPHVILTRDQITDHLRGSACDAFDRTVDVLVSRLRHKLRDSSKMPKYLKTAWGCGYQFIGSVTEIDTKAP